MPFNFKLIFAVILFFGAGAQAATPLITKINQSGHVPNDYRFSQVCEVYRTRVVVTTQMGIENSDKPVVMKRIFPAALSANIHQMIRQASLEELQVSNIQICDAPTTKVSAATPGVPSFDIFRSGSCSEARAERVGGSSYHLRQIVDSFCPETNDPGGEIEP